MAVEQVIKISLDDLKALGGIDNLKKSLGETEASTKSLKQQLREATAEVALMAEKYGEASKETVQAAKRAAELKDKIEDANDAIMAFKGEGAFLATGKALQSVASGFAAAQGAMGLFGSESENVEKAILKVQSAMALAQGLEGLEDAGRAFTQLKTVAVDAFNAIKGAIGATGIGALVIALGAVYYYWDDIKEAISGVSQEQMNLNRLTNENYEKSKQQLTTLDSQDNILKLQGKSEKEILNLKIKQYDETIKAAKFNIQSLQTLNKLRIKSLEDNYNTAKRFTDSIALLISQTLMKLTIPIDKLFAVINIASNAISGKNLINISATAELNKSLFSLSESTAKSIFDVEGLKAEAAKQQKEYEAELLKIENEKAGIQSRLLELNKNQSSSKSVSSNSTQQKEGVIKESTDPLDKINPATGQTYKSELESLKIASDARRKQIEDDLAFEDMINTQRYDMEKEWADKQKQIEKDKAQAKIDALDAVANSLYMASDILGENTAAGKALAIASSVISTYTSAQKAYEATVGIPIVGPVLAPINAGLAVAAGLKNIKSIMSVKVPNDKSSAPNISGVKGGSASMPSPTFNVAGDAGVNQIASTLANQQPIKAYVVGKEVSTQQSLDRNIVKNATLG